MNLSPHFSYEELIVTDHREFDNTPNENEIQNLFRLAEFLEVVKTVLDDRPIMVNSAFRSKAVNDACGSRDSSAHRLGLAADIRVPGLTPDQVTRALIDSKLPFDQVIREFDRWTHVAIPSTPVGQPRLQALIIDKAGTRNFA